MFTLRSYRLAASCVTVVMLESYTIVALIIFLLVLLTVVLALAALYIVRKLQMRRHGEEMEVENGSRGGPWRIWLGPWL
jgi:hypothetical protein